MVAYIIRSASPHTQGIAIRSVLDEAGMVETSSGDGFKVTDEALNTIEEPREQYEKYRDAAGVLQSEKSEMGREKERI